MKITYVKLENVAGLYVGSNKYVIEIDFSKSKNKIICISGENGSGKSVLISSLTPFATVTSLDERSTLNYIIPHKNGYKEIHYDHNGDTYIIKHYYKPTKDGGHSVKSYFIKNGEELNENGNVTSFVSLVEIHFGLTTEMMRLIRLGTNVNSFITLTPARRKEYIGKLIDEIDTYLRIYKDINEQIRVVKSLLSTNNSNLYNCHISDIVMEQEKLGKLSKEIKVREKERDKIISKISKIQALINDNDIDDLERRRKESEASILEFDKTEKLVRDLSLQHTSVEQLVVKRSDLSNSLIDTQAKINSYRISIDMALKNIERLEGAIKKVTSNNDVQSLINAKNDLQEQIKATNAMVVNFNHIGSDSSDVQYMISKLSSFNQISQMIYTFGNKPREVYLKLKLEKKSVDKFLKDQMKKTLSGVNENDLKVLIDQVFQNDMIITPNCDTEYAHCPYYRLFDTITTIKDKLEEESFDDETLRYIQVISNNIDNILNDIDRMSNIQIPGNLRDILKEDSILERMSKKLPFFDLSDLQVYLSLLKEYEIYRANVSKLKEYDYQLSIYKKSGIDNQLAEIKELQENINFYKRNIDTLTGKIEEINKELTSIDYKIGIVSKYNDSKKYRKIVVATLESTNKILKPLESASNEKRELDFSLTQITNLINRHRMDFRELDNRISEYNRLMEEGEKLSKQYKELGIILESVSTKKGIPVIYMKQYLGKIKSTTNNLLKIVYKDGLKLSKFNVTSETFEIPYVKNGTKVADVKYGSQSEVSLISMALSFALSNQLSGNYNILLLDEIDGGLDANNRSEFLRMLNIQMYVLKCEQVFIISHNVSQMGMVPMDIIKLTETDDIPSSQNVIYST